MSRKNTPTLDGSVIGVPEALQLKLDITNMSCVTNMAFIMSVTKRVVDTIVCSEVRWKNIAVKTQYNF